MSEKIMTLALGGQDRLLDVGKFWFTKYYGEAAGADPLNATSILLSPEKQFDFVVNMVFAGMRCYAKVNNKLPFTLKRDQVEDWIGVLEDEDAAKIIIQYTELTKPKPKPEGE